VTSSVITLKPASVHADCTLPADDEPAAISGAARSGLRAVVLPLQQKSGYPICASVGHSLHTFVLLWQGHPAAQAAFAEVRLLAYNPSQGCESQREGRL
jgi:hypothetical protein